MRYLLYIFFSFSYFLSFGQNQVCDTLFLLNGEKLAVKIQSETTTTYTYIPCCSECSKAKTIKKKDVDWKKIRNQTWRDLEKQKLENGIHSPFALNFELGGSMFIGGFSMELYPSERFGIRAGVGFPRDGFPIHGSILLKLGKRKRFAPSLGFTNFVGSSTDFIMLTNFYSYQKPTQFGYFRISPGVLFSNDGWFPILPFIGGSIGFNLIR